MQVTPNSTVESLLSVQDDEVVGDEKVSPSQILLIVAFVVKRQSDLFSRDAFMAAIGARAERFPLLDVKGTLRSLTECIDNDPRLLRSTHSLHSTQRSVSNVIANFTQLTWLISMQSACATPPIRSVR